MSDTFIQKVAGLARATELLLEEQKQYKEAAVKAVGNLVEIGAVKAEDREKVASSISKDPEKVFNILTNLATTNQKQAAELKKKAEELKKQAAAQKVEAKPVALGHVDTSVKASSVKKEVTSDQIWESTFGV
jgi:hypothetical protein